MVEKVSDVDSSIVEGASVEDLIAVSAGAKNSYLRLFGSDVQSSQPAAFGNDTSWSLLPGVAKSEYLRARDALLRRARDLINLEAEMIGRGEIWNRAPAQKHVFSVGDRCRVITSDSKDSDADRLESGIVIGVDGNRVVTVRTTRGDIHEVHISKVFLPPAQGLVLPQAPGNPAPGGAPGASDGIHLSRKDRSAPGPGSNNFLGHRPTCLRHRHFSPLKTAAAAAVLSPLTEG